MVYGCKSKHAYVVNYQDENEVYGWSLSTTNPAIELSKRIDGEEGKQYLILRNRLINTSNKLRRSGYTLPKKDIELIKKILNKKEWTDSLAWLGLYVNYPLFNSHLYYEYLFINY